MPIDFSFDGKNLRAQAVAARRAAELVTGISEVTRAALRVLITRSIREGIPPYDAARIIVSMVGLTERQAAAVWTYRVSLINSGLSPAKVDLAVERYAKRKLRERAITIARTETMKALNAGALEAARQAKRDGLLGRNPQKEWIVAGDEKTCPACAPMDGVQVPLKAPFVTILGSVQGPPLHPRCRCTQAITA